MADRRTPGGNENPGSDSSGRRKHETPACPKLPARPSKPSRVGYGRVGQGVLTESTGSSRGAARLRASAGGEGPERREAPSARRRGRHGRSVGRSPRPPGKGNGVRFSRLPEGTTTAAWDDGWAALVVASLGGGVVLGLTHSVGCTRGGGVGVIASVQSRTRGSRADGGVRVPCGEAENRSPRSF